MAEITKKFHLDRSKPLNRRRFSNFCNQMLVTRNSKKLGRHRRGSLLLIYVNCCIDAQSNFCVELVWTTEFRRHVVFAFPDKKERLPVYNFADHRKLLKMKKRVLRRIKP